MNKEAMFNKDELQTIYMALVKLSIGSMAVNPELEDLKEKIADLLFKDK